MSDHYGNIDDYGKVLKKNQFIFRPHYSSLYTWLHEFHNRFIMHVPEDIILANYKYYLPPWMINMCFFEQLFYQCIDKKRNKHHDRHKFDNLVFLHQYFSSRGIHYRLFSI